MATRVDLPKEIVLEALNMMLSSRKRAYNTAKNKLIADILMTEVNTVQVAINTVQETK